MLVGHWPLTESSGDATDYAGSNDGTVYGATQAGAAGPMGYDAYAFDGVDDYVDGGDPLDFTGSSPFTAACWARSPDLGGSNAYFLGSANDGVKNGWYIRFDSNVGPAGSVVVKMDDGGSYVYFASGGGYDDDAWHHAALVNDGSTLYGYVDGSEFGSQSHSVGGLNDGVLMGAVGESGGGKSYAGVDLSDVRLYDHALAPAEVAALADVGSQAAYVSPKQQL